MIEGLRASGASIEQLELSGFGPHAARRAGLLVVESEGAQATEARNHAWGRPSDAIARMFAYGRQLSAAQIAEARERIAGAAHALDRALAQVDAIVSLTAPQAALSFKAPEPVNQAEFTALANFSGCPALSIPFALDDGLPLELQMMTAAGDDNLLLAIGAALETWIGFAAAPADYLSRH